MSDFSKEARRFGTRFYLVGCLCVIALITFTGCVEVGGSSTGIDVCSGTECSDNHDESDNSTDNSDNSTS